MNIIDTPIPGLYLFQPQAIADNRGFFAEVFTQRELSQIGHTKPIIQVNHSKNVQQGTLRGMHFQYPPHAEIKIIKCIQGAIYDVAVDIRQGSPTFLQWHAHQLSEENMTLFYIPEGFAHGFQTLAPNTEIIYFSTNLYAPTHLGGLRYDDPRLTIPWPLPVTELSPRDTQHPALTPDFLGIGQPI